MGIFAPTNCRSDPVLLDPFYLVPSLDAITPKTMFPQYPVAKSRNTGMNAAGHCPSPPAGQELRRIRGLTPAPVVAANPLQGLEHDDRVAADDHHAELGLLAVILLLDGVV